MHIWGVGCFTQKREGEDSEGEDLEGEDLEGEDLNSQRGGSEEWFPREGPTGSTAQRKATLHENMLLCDISLKLALVGRF